MFLQVSVILFTGVGSLVPGAPGPGGSGPGGVPGPGGGAGGDWNAFSCLIPST